MGYLIRNDYRRAIQLNNLSDIIGGDWVMLNHYEAQAKQEVSSYLIQKYDCNAEFTETTLYAYNVTRKAKDRVYLDATAYSSTTTYALNSLVLQSGNVYRCSTAVTVAEAFNIAKWTLLGAQYDIFYVTTPKLEWLYTTEYNTGDEVFYKDKTYTALVDNTGMAPDTNSSEWGTGTAYSVAGTVWPTDTSKWTAGDNRKPQMVAYMLDIILYHVHIRIAPMNIPDIRVKRYDEVVEWLKNSAKNEWLSAPIATYQPSQGARILWGSTYEKRNNKF